MKDCWKMKVLGILNDLGLVYGCVSHFHFISMTLCVYDPVFFNVILPEAPEFCFSFLTFASAHFDVSACVALFPTDANEDGWCLPARQDEAWNIPDTDAAILDWAGTSCAQVLPPLQVPLVFFHQNKRHSKQIKLPTPESILTGRQHLWSWLVWYSTNIFCRAIATRHNRKNTAVSPQWHISVEPVSVYRRGLLSSTSNCSYGCIHFSKSACSFSPCSNTNLLGL